MKQILFFFAFLIASSIVMVGQAFGETVLVVANSGGTNPGQVRVSYDTLNANASVILNNKVMDGRREGSSVIVSEFVKGGENNIFKIHLQPRLESREGRFWFTISGGSSMGCSTQNDIVIETQDGNVAPQRMTTDPTGKSFRCYTP